MATASFPSQVGGTTTTRSVSRPAAIPWYLWCAALAVTSVTIGAHWDVSWHRSIGRDSFWTAAHMAIYLCGVLAGVSCGYLILVTTFLRPAAMVERSVQIFGLRGPLGAFLAAWGGITMLTSAPFDNWWHNAYGLDVKIVSPPHVVLMLGIGAVGIGTMFLVLAEMNRAKAAEAGAAGDSASFVKLQWLFLYIAGLQLVLRMFFVMEYTWDVKLHSASAYIAMALGVPMMFAVCWWASRHRWTATIISAFYMLFTIGLILILPLFAAEPKLGPVFHQVTQFIPPKFPILLILPALALDLLWQRVGEWKAWKIALLSGPVFVAVVAAAQWPFASFLLSPLSENRFFGTGYHDFGTPSYSYELLRKFFQPDAGVRLAIGLAVAALLAMVSSYVGIAFGRWMQKVQR